MLTGTTDQVLGGAIYSLLTRDDAFIGASARRVFRIDQNDHKDPTSGMKLTQEVQLPDELFDNDKTKRGLNMPLDATFGMGMTLNGLPGGQHHGRHNRHPRPHDLETDRQLSREWQ